MKVNCMLLSPSQCHRLWGSNLFQWSQWSGCGAIQQYHSQLRDSLPVSARASTRRKENTAVWGRWQVESWPSGTVHRYKFTYPFIQICPHWSLLLFQTEACLQLQLQPLQLLSACWWHSLLGLCVVVCSLSASASGTRRDDIALSQHQTHKNSSKQL